MATATLPEPIVRGLRELAALPEDVFGRLLASFKAMPLEIRQHRVFPDISSADLPERGEAIKDALFALLLSRTQRQLPIDDLVDVVARSPGFDASHTEALKTRAKSMLEIDTLDLIARAHSVLLEHGAVYSSARIISDIRPVFGSDVKEQPDAAVIVHMLNMFYYHAGEYDHFAVALDEKDVDQLIQVLQRAKDKNETLKKTAERSGMRYIGVV